MKDFETQLKEYFKLYDVLDKQIHIFSGISKTLKEYQGFFAFEREILILALRNALSMARYASDYASVLQAYMNNEDFDKAIDEYNNDILPKYSKSLRQEVDNDRIAMEAKIILSALNEELGTDEIAELLNLDVYKTEEALQLYKKKTEDTKEA